MSPNAPDVQFQRIQQLPTDQEGVHGLIEQADQLADPTPYPELREGGVAKDRIEPVLWVVVPHVAEHRDGMLGMSRCNANQDMVYVAERHGAISVGGEFPARLQASVEDQFGGPPGKAAIATGLMIVFNTFNTENLSGLPPVK